MALEQHFKESITVDLPVRTVYDQWTQFEEFPRFMEGVEQVEQLDDTHLRWTTEIGLASREFTTVIDEQIPDKIISWHATGGEVDHAGKVTFEPVGAGQTEVEVVMAYHPDSFTEKVADRTGTIQRRVRGDLKRFKEFIEERGVETGAYRKAH